ncbi:MAG TPA: hypothetical protein V6D14_16135 [Coleofasciculaceae cyanobacterium]
MEVQPREIRRYITPDDRFQVESLMMVWRARSHCANLSIGLIA